MICPECHSFDTVTWKTVIPEGETRGFVRINGVDIPCVMRRHRCRQCTYSWPTVELPGRVRVKDSKAETIEFDNFNIET